MTGRVIGWMRGRDVAVIYALILVIVSLTLTLGPDSWRERAIDFSSTNLANMRKRPLVVMALSAFILPSAFGLVQIPILVLVLSVIQRRLGRSATIIAAIFGHAGATLLVTVLLVTGIRHGLVDPAVRSADDVGVSYAVVALAGMCAPRIPRTRWRLCYVVALSLLFVYAVIVSRTFTDLGHLIAWLIGLGLALIVTGAQRSAASLPPAA